MARIRRGTTVNRKHKKILAQAKGFRGTKSKLFKVAKEAVMHAGAYAFSGRKERKRQKRTLWIVQINAALKNHNLTYSNFIKGLSSAKIHFDRKILSEIAASDEKTFKQIVEEAKTHI